MSWEREGERERGGREGERQRDRQTDTHTHIQRWRQREMEMRDRERERERFLERVDRQTDRQDNIRTLGKLLAVHMFVFSCQNKQTFPEATDPESSQEKSSQEKDCLSPQTTRQKEQSELGNVETIVSECSKCEWQILSTVSRRTGTDLALPNSYMLRS